jgi:hypothetical protein
MVTDTEALAELRAMSPAVSRRSLVYLRNRLHELADKEERDGRPGDAAATRRRAWACEHGRRALGGRGWNLG